MAKGDSSPTSAAQTAPKMDQYSVMHKIMENLGGGAGSIAPSAMPTAPDMAGSAGPINNDANAPIINMPYRTDWNRGPARFGQMGNNIVGMGASQGGSMAPTNPQDMIRRSMMSKGQFGQM